MRLGAAIPIDSSDPDKWVQSLRCFGYTAAICPVGPDADDDRIKAFAAAAADANILIAEVGAWSNPIARDAQTRDEAVRKNITQLALAERIGARLCVNIAGSRGEKWDGPHPDNISDDTFDLIVETVRHIIDSVKPTRTHYCLETMPFTLPDSPDSYVALLQAIDRKACAVHLDPVNMINCPRRFYRSGAFIRECFEKLGPLILSCHAKDIALSDNLTVHLDEVRPGLGKLDYAELLRQLNELDPDTPLIIEHLPDAQEYQLATDYIRAVAKQEGVNFC